MATDTPRFAIVNPILTGHGQIIALSDTPAECMPPYICVELLGYHEPILGHPAFPYEVWQCGEWKERF